jgi:hypothetical protein
MQNIQREGDGVTQTELNAAMAVPDISAKQALCNAIVQHIAGGTIDVKGQETKSSLHHRCVAPAKTFFFR